MSCGCHGRGARLTLDRRHGAATITQTYCRGMPPSVGMFGYTNRADCAVDFAITVVVVAISLIASI